MKQNREIKVNVESSRGVSMRMDIDIETPFNVFMEFVSKQINEQDLSKDQRPEEIFYLEDRIIKQNETGTLNQLGFKNSCNFKIESKRIEFEIQFEINIPMKDTILCSKNFHTNVKIEDLDDVILEHAELKTQIQKQNFKIIKYTLEEIFELSKQRNASIEQVIQDNCKLIVELEIKQTNNKEEISIQIKTPRNGTFNVRVNRQDTVKQLIYHLQNTLNCLTTSTEIQINKGNQQLDGRKKLIDYNINNNDELNLLMLFRGG